MIKDGKYITSLSSEEALDFIMQSDQFHNFELPEYFDFTTVLQHVRSKVGELSYDECIAVDSVSDIDGINVEILLNKDGKYGVRPLMLCNPYLYYFLAREICGKGNWDRVKENFERCMVPHITSCALPIVPDKTEKFYRAATILNWWNSIEQRAIELSLDYSYMFVSDITNCYGAINPQAIDWALSRKGTKFETEENHDIANNLIRYLRDLQHGRNVGIPQGSTLFDLVGEIVLSYSDLLLSEAIEKEGITSEYEILRYRDDYKIFCNHKNDLEKISYILQQVLESLNFRMNSAKTFISNSIILDTIKSDKLFYIFNTPIFNKQGCDFDGFQKYLLYILMFGRKYPNAGQLRTMLSDIDKRIEIKLTSHGVGFTIEGYEGAEDNKGVEFTRLWGLVENVKSMSAICAQIAIENVSVVHYALRVISRMMKSLGDNMLRDEIVSKVCKRLIGQPNSTYTKLWLQNMTYSRDKVYKVSPYDVNLCKLVMGESTQLWNNDWLKSKLIEDFPQDSVVDKKVLENVGSIITFRETRAYMDVSNKLVEANKVKII